MFPVRTPLAHTHTHARTHARTHTHTHTHTHTQHTQACSQDQLFSILFYCIQLSLGYLGQKYVAKVGEHTSIKTRSLNFE